MDTFLNSTDPYNLSMHSSAQKWLAPTTENQQKTLNQCLQTRKFAVISLLVHIFLNHLNLNFFEIDFIYLMGYLWVSLFELFNFHAEHSKHSFVDGNFVYFWHKWSSYSEKDSANFKSSCPQVNNWVSFSVISHVSTSGYGE